MKYVLAFCLVICVAGLSHVNANCNANCPETEDIVWAVGGGCRVFRNKCFFDKENCTRKPPLTITTKEECQKLCNSFCIQVYQPVGFTYKGEERSFGNQCEMNLHICQTGETPV